VKGRGVELWCDWHAEKHAAGHPLHLQVGVHKVPRARKRIRIGAHRLRCPTSFVEKMRLEQLHAHKDRDEGRALVLDEGRNQLRHEARLALCSLSGEQHACTPFGGFCLAAQRRLRRLQPRGQARHVTHAPYQSEASCGLGRLEHWREDGGHALLDDVEPPAGQGIDEGCMCRLHRAHVARLECIKPVSREVGRGVVPRMERKAKGAPV